MPYTPADRNIISLDFAEIEVGQAAEISHKITQADMETFAKLTGDFNPIHLDEEFARASRFGKRVVFGMLTASFISTMIGMVLPGKGALWTSQSLQFKRPTFVNDVIRVQAIVKQKSSATRTLVLETQIYNQYNKLLIDGEAIVMLMAPKEAS